MTRKILGSMLLIAALGLFSTALAIGKSEHANPHSNGYSPPPSSTDTTSSSQTSSSSSQTTASAPSSSTGNGQGTSTNNGGNHPSCGNSCDTSHNPTGYNKPCRPVPGNGCHRLPHTPCGRGHNGVRAKNKHCGPAVPITLLKEQRQLGQPDTAFTTGVISVPLNQSDLEYRITVKNLTSTVFSLNASDPNCSGFAASGLSPSGTQTLPAMGTVVYRCNVDVIPGIGDPVQIPNDAQPGQGPYPYTNTVTVMAVPSGGGTPITLTRSVTASAN